MKKGLENHASRLMPVSGSKTWHTWPGKLKFRAAPLVSAATSAPVIFMVETTMTTSRSRALTCRWAEAPISSETSTVPLSPCSSTMCSERMPSLTAPSLALFLARAAYFSSDSSTVMPPSSTAYLSPFLTSLASKIFILGEPMNSATNRL